jgi:hypothetical protein
MGTFEQHRNACLALGGDMVAYMSYEAQLAVEKYFLKQTPLHSYWWVWRRKAQSSGRCEQCPCLSRLRLRCHAADCHLHAFPLLVESRQRRQCGASCCHAVGLTTCSTQAPAADCTRCKVSTQAPAADCTRCKVSTQAPAADCTRQV